MNQIHCWVLMLFSYLFIRKINILLKHLGYNSVKLIIKKYVRDILFLVIHGSLQQAAKIQSVIFQLLPQVHII